MATIGQALTSPEAGWQRLDSGSGLIRKTGYSAQSATSAFGGSYHYVANGSTNPIIFSFIGTQLRIICYRHTATYYSTAVQLWIDGVLRSTFSLRGATAVHQMLMAEVIGLTNTNHYVEIKTASNDAAGVNIDAIDIDDTGQFINPLAKEIAVKTNLASMGIGDAISCEYVASTANKVGSFFNLGAATKAEIPITGTTTPNGSFYFIKADTGLLIADRVIQTGISWDTLNTAKYIHGYKTAMVSSIDFNNGLNDANGDVWTANGAAVVSTNNIYEGSASLYTPSGDFISINNSGFATRTTDFTLQFKMFIPGTATYCGVSSYTTTSTVLGIAVQNDAVSIGYSGSSQNVSPSGYYVIGQWAHYKLIRQGGICYYFVNDVLKASASVTNSISSENFAINARYASGSYSGSNAYYDQFSFEQGVVLDDQVLIIRSLSGGTSFNNESTIATLNKDQGKYPTVNEWDTYIVNSTLENKITAGDAAIWNWKAGDSNLATWTTDTPHLTLGASSTRVTRGFGRARSFNGTSDRIVFAAKIIPNGSKTISFRFKQNSIPSGWQRICSTGIVGTDASLFNMYIRPTSASSAGSMTVAIAKVGTTVLVATTSVNICDGLWHDIVYVQDDTNRNVKIYIDGVLDVDTTGYQSGQFDNVTYTRNLVIGATYLASTPTYQEFFGGSLSEFKVVNAANTLVLYLPMLEASGNVIDQSGNGYTGTATGTTVAEYPKLIGAGYPVTTATTSGGALGFRPVIEYTEQ